VEGRSKFRSRTVSAARQQHTSYRVRSRQLACGCRPHRCLVCPCESPVVHWPGRLDKLGVTGSSPVPPTSEGPAKQGLRASRLATREGPCRDCVRFGGGNGHCSDAGGRLGPTHRGPVPCGQRCVGSTRRWSCADQASRANGALPDRRKAVLGPIGPGGEASGNGRAGHVRASRRRAALMRRATPHRRRAPLNHGGVRLRSGSPVPQGTGLSHSAFGGSPRAEID
jgi:hypothetical protein